nr:CRISPR-associated endonuclease Cas1 [Undibacterium oligocarboniphilum]
MWLPYLLSINPIPRKKHQFRFEYNGGEVEVDLKNVDFILIYGGKTNCTFPLEFLDLLNDLGIPLAIHRRNQPRPYFFSPSNGSDNVDILSKQIEFRTNERKRCFIAKTLIRARLEKMESLIAISGTTQEQLSAAISIAVVRNIEATATRRYWNAYYDALNIDVSRREAHIVNSALDACSTFMAGILLRWILFHKLAPTHGYLHQPTNYISLVYDLIEPFRYIFEQAVFASYQRLSENNTDENELIAESIKELKVLLNEEVWVPTMQITARRKNLMHGVVLALRSYLAGETKRFAIPAEGIRKGGRPIKAAFRIPGAK